VKYGEAGKLDAGHAGCCFATLSMTPESRHKAKHIRAKHMRIVCMYSLCLNNISRNAEQSYKIDSPKQFHAIFMDYQASVVSIKA
jgi:hypothetical protein